MNKSHPGAATHEELRMQALGLNLREHNIGFFLPQGAHLEGRTKLPYGALIAGTFVGELLVENGSLIIVGGGLFQGIAEADRVYVEGTVASADALDERQRTNTQGAADNPALSSRSAIIARKLFAASSDARIDAEVYAPNFTATRAKLWGRMLSLDEVSRRPLGGDPHALGRRQVPGQAMEAAAERHLADAGAGRGAAASSAESNRLSLAARAANAALHTLNPRAGRR